MKPLGETGHKLLQEAYDAYEALPDNKKSSTSASGVILHRKDHLVTDGTFKWVPTLWSFQENKLVLTQVHGSDVAPHEVSVFPIMPTTQYKKPKSKHYPLQFGSSAVHSSVIMGEVHYLPTGYANSPLDPLGAAATGPAAAPGGMKSMEAVCKVASLETSELEKLLMCVQAVVEEKAPETYLS